MPHHVLAKSIANSISLPIVLFSTDLFMTAVHVTRFSSSSTLMQDTTT